MSLKKHVALLLSIMFIVACMATSASAAEYRVAGTKGTTGISDSYANGIFYKNFQKVQLTGDGRIDTVAIALSQIGYQEGNDDTQYAGTYPGSTNYTEFNRNFGDYGIGYGGSAYAWCASFVSFALYQAGTHDYNKLSDWSRDHTGDSNYIWREISCIQWLNQLDRHGYFKKSQQYGGSYKPQTGDLIFFGDSATTSSHIGIVVYCEGSTVYTVEGNTSQAAGLNTNGGGVYYKSYALSNSRIRGYGVLPYKTNANAIKPDYSCKNPTTGLYVNTNYQNTGVDIQTYRDAACTSKGPKMGTNVMFEAIEFVSENVAKCTYYRSNGTSYAPYECYVKFDGSAKLVQATSYGGKYQDPSTNPTDPPVDDPVVDPSLNTFVPAASGNQYVAHAITNYTVNGEAKGTATKDFDVDYEDRIGLTGWAGFEQSIRNSGYYFDGDKDNIRWNSNFVGSADATIQAQGGSKAKTFNFNVDVDLAPEGEHTVTFILKLNDGTYVILDTLTFTSTKTEAPTEAPTEKPTEAPTEKPTEAPTEEPTEAPTEEPTEAPTEEPTEAPTEEPTEAPTEKPTEAPTEEPTEAPTEEPTEAPTEEPTEAPTEEPTEEPTEDPTEASTTEAPTEEPTTEAPTTEAPTEAPTSEPEANVPTTGTNTDARGCGSTIGGVSAIVVAVATTCAIFRKKRRR